MGVWVGSGACRTQEAHRPSTAVRTDVGTRDAPSAESIGRTADGGQTPDPCDRGGMARDIEEEERNYPPGVPRPVWPRVASNPLGRVAFPGLEGAVFNPFGAEGFVPTLSDIAAFEAGLEAYMRRMQYPPVARIRCLHRYARQYLTGAHQGNYRVLNVQFLCDRPRYWETVPFMPTDGGDCYFGVTYNVLDGRYLGMDGEVTTRYVYRDAGVPSRDARAASGLTRSSAGTGRAAAH